MSVSNELVRVSLTASASQTVFSFTNILILANTDLRVFQNDVQLSLGPDYSVTLNSTAPSDGFITLASGATAGDIILIERDIPRRQPTVYNPGTSFPAKSHENALDRLTLEISDLHNRVNYVPIFARGRDENFSWSLTNLPDATTPKIPVYDPATKTVSWSDTGAPTASLDFSALTGTLDVSGDDVRVPGFTKAFANAVLRDIRAYLEDWKSVKDFGAVGDGVTDDTTAINNALATGGHIWFPAGTYKVSALLSLVSNTVVCGAGMEVCTLTTTGDHSFFVGTDVDDIEICGFSIRGIHPGGSGSNTTFDAINLTHTGGQQRRIRIHDNFIEDMIGRGIVLADNSTDCWVYNNLVQNCLIGIFQFKSGFGATISNNVLRDIRTIGIYVDDATAGDTAMTNIIPQWVTVSNNIILNGGFDPVNTGFGIVVSASWGVTVTGNVVDSVGDPGTQASAGINVNSGQDDFDEAEFVVVANNTVTRCSSYGILIEASHDIVAAGNVLRDNHNWTSPVANAAEIVIRDHATSASAANQVYVYGNSIRNSGITDARATIGIDVQDTSNLNIHLGENAITGMTTTVRSLADAGDIFWHAVSMESSLPTHDDGFKGRIVYETDRQLLMQNNGTKWQPIAPIAWCTFDGTGADPISIKDGANVTNVTKSGTGDYIVNFAETFDNTNFAVVASATVECAKVGALTTTTAVVQTENDAGTATDSLHISVVVFGSAS